MKPQTIAPAYDRLPGQLRDTPSWLLWEFRMVNGRWSKIPLIADRSRQMAKSNDHRTWRSFEEAKSFVNTASGLGMVLTRSLCGIDLDSCRNKETGEITPWAKKIISALNSYTEISPSGEGLHVVVELVKDLPAGGRKLRGGKERAGWEIAIFDKSSPRYFAMTGVTIDGYDQVRRVDLSDFYSEFERGGFDPVPPKPNGKANGDAKLNKFERLMAGQWEGLGYGSQSEADAALVWYLAKKHRNDSGEIDKAFRGSAMMRDKWDEPRPGGTYGGVTIAKCLDKRQADDKLLRNDQGRIRPVVANAITMLRTSSEWTGVFAFDQFALRTTTKIPAPWQTNPGADWSDYDDTRTCEWLQHHGLLIKTHVAAEAVQAVAKENPFHPVREYLNSIMWDGEPRIDHWLPNYLGAEDSEYARAIGSRWLISAVVRIFRPGSKADHCLVLEGRQGIQKSTWLRTLAGNDNWFTDHLSELGTKDSRVELRGKWIIELAELHNLKRGDLDRVKSFITTPIDDYRLPYGRRSEAVPRQCVFAGSVNDQTNLMDETGNRRFWPVRCGSLDIEALARDRDQLWAEAYDRFKGGAVWWLETEELNEAATKEQEDRYEVGAWDDIILAWVEDPQQRSDRTGEHGALLPINPFDSEPGRVTAIDILLHAIGKPLHQIGKQDLNQVVRCLVHAGWTRETKQTWREHRKRRVRFWTQPVLNPCTQP